MGPFESIVSFYNRYFDFDGRSSRSEFWWVQLFFVVVLTVIFIFFTNTNSIEAIENNNINGSGMLLIMAAFIFAITGLIPMIALSVRRFHDQNKSGWFYLLNFIPYIGGIILLVFMCLRGTDGPNRFGPNPLNLSHIY